jgi:hypothetical protein
MFPQFYAFLDFMLFLGGLHKTSNLCYTTVSAMAADGQPMSDLGQHVCVHQTVIVALSKHVT